MADTRTGAAAPISPAALAASTQTPTTTAPEPRALLQELSGLMQESGFGHDHPWCMAVAASLAAHPAGPAVAANRLRPVNTEPPGTSAPNVSKAEDIQNSINSEAEGHPSTPPAGTGLLRPAQECGDRVRFELHPVLAGLSLLTNSVRVLQAVSDHAVLSRTFADALTDACPSWSDPFAHGGDASAESVVSDLARYAADLCAEILVMDMNGGAA